MDDDEDLTALGQTFATLSCRFARQGRRVRKLALKADEAAVERRLPPHRRRATLEAIRAEVGYHAAWARWSTTSDEMAALADRIICRQVRSLGDLAVKFEVLAWMLLNDGAVVDTEAVRYVRRFGRELRRLAAPVR